MARPVFQSEGAANLFKRELDDGEPQAGAGRTLVLAAKEAIGYQEKFIFGNARTFVVDGDRGV